MPSLTIWRQVPSLTIWSQVPSLPIWSQVPSLTIWSQVPSLTIWSQVPSLTIWNQVPSQHHLELRSEGWGVKGGSLAPQHHLGSEQKAGRERRIPLVAASHMRGGYMSVTSDPSGGSAHLVADWILFQRPAAVPR